ncbi:MAG TPA: histidine kinase, partial [Stellaceae bacterium]|nr:histidine kinase [Stellaceae bacterium]
MTEPFAAAFAEGDAATLAAECLAQLPQQGSGCNFGVLYVSEPAAPVLPYIVQELAAGSGIGAWVGGVGLGVVGAGREAYDTPAAAVLTAALPDDAFRLFGATADPAADLPQAHAGWIERATPTLALVHGDPRCPDIMRAAADAAAASGAFLVGGLVSHRCPKPLLAGGAGDLGK